jgi:hypothetical protein
MVENNVLENLDVGAELPSDKPYVDPETKKVTPIISPQIPEAGGDAAGEPEEIIPISVKHEGYKDIKLQVTVPPWATDEEINEQAMRRAAIIKEKRESAGLFGMHSSIDSAVNTVGDVTGSAYKKWVSETDKMRLLPYGDLINRLPANLRIPALVASYGKSVHRAMNDPDHYRKYGSLYSANLELGKFLEDTARDLSTNLAGKKGSVEVLDFLPKIIKGKPESFESYMTRMENDHPWFTFGAVMYLEMKAIQSGAKIVQKAPGVLAKGGIKGTTILSPRLGRIAKRGALSLAETLKNMSKMRKASVIGATALSAYNVDHLFGKIGLRQSDQISSLLSAGAEAAFPLGTYALKRVTSGIMKTSIGEGVRQYIEELPARQMIRKFTQNHIDKLVKTVQEGSPTKAGRMYNTLKNMGTVNIIRDKSTFKSTLSSIDEVLDYMKRNVSRKTEDVIVKGKIVGQKSVPIFKEHQDVENAASMLRQALQGKRIRKPVFGTKPAGFERTKTVKVGETIARPKVIDIAEVHELTRILANRIKVADKKTGSFLAPPLKKWYASLMDDVDRLQFSGVGPQGKAQAARANELHKRATAGWRRERTLLTVHELIEKNAARGMKAGGGPADLNRIDITSLIIDLKAMKRKTSNSYDPLFVKGMKRTERAGGGKWDDLIRGKWAKKEPKKIKYEEVDDLDNMIKTLEEANKWATDKTGKGELVIAGRLATAGAWLTGILTGGAIGWTAGEKTGAAAGAFLGARFPVFLLNRAKNSKRGREFLAFLINNPPQQMSRNMTRGYGMLHGGARMFEEPRVPTIDYYEQQKDIRGVSPRKKLKRGLRKTEPEPDYDKLQQDYLRSIGR